MSRAPARSATSRGARSRERIIRAATGLFARHGYQGVTMRAIGAEAGFDNSSLYKHFHSKAELAEQILDGAAGALLECVERLERPGPVDLEQLVDVCVEAARYLSEDPDAASLLLEWMCTPPEPRAGLDFHVGPDEVDRPSVQIFQILSKWLRRAQRAGAIRRVDTLEAGVNLLAILFLRPATARSLLVSQEPEPYSPAARRVRLREVAAFVRGALAPEPR